MDLKKAPSAQCWEAMEALEFPSGGVWERHQGSQEENPRATWHSSHLTAPNSGPLRMEQECGVMDALRKSGVSGGH